MGKYSADALPGFLPFEHAKLYIHRLGFESSAKCHDWKKHGNRPSFIPSSPDLTYKNEGWIGWQDWVGCGFLSFEKARTFMRKLGLKSRKQYLEWLASNKHPKNIPYNPEKEYKYTGWINMNDWMGI